MEFNFAHVFHLIFFLIFVTSKLLNVKTEESRSNYILNYICGVVKPSDPHPPFVMGLRLMLRPIIAYEEDRGDHGIPKNCVEDNFVLG